MNRKTERGVSKGFAIRFNNPHTHSQHEIVSTYSIATTELTGTVEFEVETGNNNLVGKFTISIIIF